MANSYTVFSFSDAHIGNKDSLLSPKSLLTSKQRRTSYVNNVKRDNMLQAVEENIRQADVIVLNGDIIDKMRGLSEKEQDKIIAYSLDTLENWATTYPEKTFYYVLGNHEGYDPYRDYKIQQRIQYELNLPNLHFTDSGVIVGDVLFMHGDLPGYGLHASARHSPLRSDNVIHLNPENEASLELYNALQTRLELLQPDEDFLVLVHEDKPIALTTEMLEDLHVMFGHTHRPTDITLPNGKTIMNGGYLKYDPNTKWYKNDTPYALQQSILHIEDGMLMDKERAFPATRNWADVVTQMQEKQARHVSQRG